jgi:hypothetical protein
MYPPLEIRQTSMRQSISFHTRVSITIHPSHNSGDTVAKILTFTERHIWYYCLLAANQGNYVHRLFLIKTWRVFLSIGVRIITNYCAIYLLGIFKMFHGLMNNPVLTMHGPMNVKESPINSVIICSCLFFPNKIATKGAA